MSGLTGNYNNYSAVELEKALNSWVNPYPKPIILNHDLNTEPIGRVMAAKMDKEEDGAPFVRLQIAITDPVAAQKIMDKRYLTGSVGGRAGKAVCSISGEDLAAEDSNGRPKMPKYRRGQVYKGKLAFIDMQDISFKEYSFVNQPADQRSGVRSKSKADGNLSVSDSDWVAKSSAFILKMDEEDIYSISESESIFKGMKKKESRPVYLQLKGSFLTAMAVNESENYNIKNNPLLSTEQESNNNEENSEMTILKEEEDILAVAKELSDDLSSIAADAAKKEDSTESTEVPSEAGEDKVEDATEEVVEENKEEENSEEEISTDKEEESDVQEKAESDKSEESVEEPESNQEQEVEEENSSELNDKEEVAEQKNDELSDRIKLLEEENKNLKAALHRVLAERVVDAKIAAGVENPAEREVLVADHVTRTPSSLADSLRDLAKMPVKKVSTTVVPEITSEAENAREELNVASIEDVDSEKKESVPSAEQLFVDALMGRRSL